MAGDPNCKTCRGVGWVRLDETHKQQCRCEWRQQISKHLGPEIADAPNILSSPLYSVKNSQITDRTGQNLFIYSTWRALLPHLKWTLANKGVEFRFKVISDQDIKQVFVGAMNFRAMVAADRGDEPAFNSLDDLVGSVDLLVLKFGFLGHKNIAAPGATLEALYIRESKRLPTWLVSLPDRPFVNSHAHSPELEMYIDRKFKKLDLDSASLPDDPVEDKEAPTDGMAIDAEEPSEENAVLPDGVVTPAAPAASHSSGSIDTSQLDGDEKWKPRKKSSTSSHKKKRNSDPDDGLPTV